MSTNPTDSNRRNAEPPRAQTRGREQAIDDIMTSPLRTVLLSDPAETVAAVFVEHGISAAPVSDAQGLVVGVISKTDLVQRCYRDGQHHPEAERATAGELMTPLILGVSRATPITRAAALMAYECVHHVIVRDKVGKPVGMVSSLDIMEWLAQRHGYAVPARAPGAARDLNNHTLHPGEEET